MALENVVTPLFQNYENKKGPVDPFAIAESLGVKVLLHSTLDKACSCLQFNKTPIISINPQESIIRQRFALAHALGHLYLNHPQQKYMDTPAHYTSAHPNPLEIEANTFAITLLLPKKFFTKYLCKNYSIDQLALFFGVSNTAIHKRLEMLRYI